MGEILNIIEHEDGFIDQKKESLKGLKEGVMITAALAKWESDVPKERLSKVSEMLDRGVSLIGEPYNLGGILGKGKLKGIDCSHFAAYSLGLKTWKNENTRSLDKKYKKHEVGMNDVKPGDLIMWPWHYDEDVGRSIGHVEIFVGETNDGRIVTLGASGLSRKGDKYTADGKKLPQHNCVGFSVRNQEAGMRVLRA